LRKNVNGTVSGLRPASFVCEAKFVIWATTRHGAVTGDTRASESTGTMSLLTAAAEIASRSRSSWAVVAALVAILTAPSGVATYQASTVRKMVVVMSSRP
jgi:hypothetical protein